MVSSTPRPHFIPGKDPVPILQEAGWAPGLVWTGGKSRPYRDPIADRNPIHKVCEMHVYIQNGRLRYVVSVPLVNKVEFKAYHLMPVPIPINKDKPIYIVTVKSILCVDKIWQYYYFSSDLELQECKESTKQRYVW